MMGADPSHPAAPVKKEQPFDGAVATAMMLSSGHPADDASGSNDDKYAGFLDTMKGPAPEAGGPGARKDFAAGGPR